MAQTSQPHRPRARTSTLDLETRIERIPQPIAEQIDPEHGHENGQSRESRQPPSGRDVDAAVGEHPAPRRRRRLTPSPRNDSADSITITRAMSSVATTSHGVKAFGRMWRTRTRPSPLPRACAACTNSRSRKESTAPRTTRAYTTQLDDTDDHDDDGQARPEDADHGDARAG